MKRMIIFLLLISLLLCGCGGQPQTEAPESTGLPANIMQKEDPKGDEEMNVLFVSNSTSVYFPDELHGMLTAAGYQNVTLATVYYSGCSLKQHNTWLKEDKPAYRLYLWTDNGRKAIDDVSLRSALQHANWDLISFDNNAASFKSGDVQTALSEAEPHFGELLSYIKQQYPLSRYAWHQVWSNEIGYSMAFKMETVAQRTKIYETKKGVMEHMQEKYGLEVVPTGDAWEKVRDLPLFTTPIEGLGAERFTLCSRVNNGLFTDDFTHDGDMGGGQYLNACVWFEILTGESCIGNTFRPKYELGGIDCSLTEEKIGILQNAAHEAVAARSK